jgi:CBS domain-containing protein
MGDQTTVRDVMRAGLITCAPSASLSDVAEMLVAHAVHAVVVVGSDGAPAGVVSDIDLLAGEWLAVDESSRSALRTLTAGDLASSPVQAIASDATLADAARALTAARVHRLIVEEGGVPVGVVSVSDLIRYLAQTPKAGGRVSDAMTSGLVVCRRGTSIAAAARVMHERRSRSVVVVERTGAAVGVVTGADLVQTLAGDSPSRTVDDLMQPPITVARDASLRQAADLLLHHEIHRLVVVDPQDPEAFPLGILSTSDIVAATAVAAAWHEASA